MDGWGSEEISKLSLPTTSTGTQKTIVNISSSISPKSSNDLSTFLNSKDKYKNNTTKDDSDDSLENDGKEKTDATPENLKKIDDVILTSTTYCTGVDDSTNKLGEKQKTTIENTQTKNNSNNTDTNHNRNVNYANEIRSSSSAKKQEGEIKLFENISNENFDLIKSGVADELKIIEIDDIQIDKNKNDNKLRMSVSDSLPTQNEATLASNSLAFTIDFGNGQNSANPNAKAKYKSLLERFQSRHKRGASLSKLEVVKTGTQEKENKKHNLNNSNVISNNNCASKKNNINQTSINNINNLKEENINSETNTVKMRIRERSTCANTDPTKRHSWSPRTSAVEQDGVFMTNNRPISKPSKLASKTSQIQQPDMNLKKLNYSTKNSNKNYLITSGSNYNQINTAKSKQFNPEKTSMQRALEKIDFLCQEPPLDNFCSKGYQTCGSDDVSETGTYTLDGDNYTEEQKDLMNIDKSKLNQLQQQHHVLAYDIKVLSNINRPTDLPINKISNFNNFSNNENRHFQRKNILEISYKHDSAIDKPKISYLDKFKSRMKGKKSPEKILETSKVSAPTSSPTGDMGTFTSVTTSGVLSKKSSLDPKPKLTRKSSLTTSQIDSSEYVSSTSIGCNVGDSENSNTSMLSVNKEFNKKNTQMSHSFTDYEKAEYRLNVFTNKTDSQLLTDYESAVTPDSPKSIDLKISDTAVLKTAQSKNDWIQEWARNARARSVTSSVKPTDHYNHHRTKLCNTGNSLMTRSYNCEYLEENNSGFSDNSGQGPVVYCNKPIERFKSHAIGDYNVDYSSSDPNVCRRSAGSSSPNLDSNFKSNYSRPPLSPSKIPSPLHSSRNRSISKTRSSLQDLSPLGVNQHNQHLQDSEFNIQKTVLPNLSRKNSLKNLNSLNQSPKRVSNTHHYSADEYSPPGHNLGNSDQNILRGDGNAGLHRRNLSFDYRAQTFHNTNSKPNANNYMSQSYSNEMNNFTDYSNDYRLPRPRKNSFDSTSYRSHQQLFGNQLMGSPSVRQINSGTLIQQQSNRNQRNMDQTYSIKQNQSQIYNKRPVSQQPNLQQQTTSPLKRSSSFSTKSFSNNNTNIGNNRYTSVYKTVTPITAQKYASAITAQQQKRNIKNPLQKSASSSSFRKMYSDYDDSVAYYINDEDDLDYCSSEEFDEPFEEISSTAAPHTTVTTAETNEPPLTNTRYNKALLMRIERSKQKVAGNNVSKPAPGGVMACPNTPELPRRSVQSAGAIQQQRSSMRQSVPRDSSLNRLKGEVPNSLASAKKQILQTASKTSVNTTAQPRYLDISKYKPAQGATFLKKDESKSTLQKQTELKKSPSNATVTLSRADPTRTSNRSMKSVSSVNIRPSSGSNKGARDSSVSKQKEVELEMWRRRAKYDPMRAAMEDKRKKEEAKKNSALKSSERQSRSPNRRGEF